MPLPFAAEVSLTDEQREPLERIARAASTPQSLAFRARIVLRAAEPDRPPNLQIAAELAALGTRSPCGETASSNRGCPVCKTHHVRGDRPAFPPSAQVDVVSLATSQPSEHGGTATRWTLSDIAATILNQPRTKRSAARPSGVSWTRPT